MSAVESSSLMQRGKNQPHDKLSIALLFSAFFTYVLTVAFNGVAGAGIAVPEIFKSTVGNISDKFDTYITPAGFTFSIWSIIYIWLAASLIILIVTLFISNQNGKLYLNPPFATPLVTGTMTVNFLLNLAWIFLWDREYQWVAFVVLLLLFVSGVTVTGAMARNIDAHKEEYAKGSNMFSWGIVYRIMMNGFAVYTTWCLIATLINLTVALVYASGTDMTKTCLAALSLLVIFHVAYYILENFFFGCLLRYLLTPYVVVIWAVNGIRAKIQEKNDENVDVPLEIENFVAAILVIASITLGIRLICFFYFMCRKPGNRVCA